MDSNGSVPLNGLRTAWRIDKYKDYLKVRKDIAAIKVMLPTVWHDIAGRALQIHGSLGVSQEMPFAEHVIGAFRLGIVDGPTEVHKVTIARQVLRDYAHTTVCFHPGTFRHACRREGKICRPH